MSIVINRLDAKAAREHIPALAEILSDVVNGGASVSFMPPLSIEAATEYWHHVIDDVAQQRVFLLVAQKNGTIVGTVQLAPARQPNAPHRAEVVKLLVHSGYRRQGIASQLMAAVEAVALENDRWLLFLDSERGSDGPPFYEKVGYTRVGAIEKFALNAANGEFTATVLYYKLLQ